MDVWIEVAQLSCFHAFQILLLATTFYQAT